MPQYEGKDRFLSRLRECVTATIALIVMIGTTILIIITIEGAYSASADQFARLKDILLFVNPLLGVVVGYYFNKTSTEGRAENAEATAQHANVAAQEATQERYQAQTEASEAKRQEQKIKSGLQNLTQATEQYLAAAPTRQPGTLGANPNPALDQARAKLDSALAQAINLMS
jgi:hypothetical protein